MITLSQVEIAQNRLNSLQLVDLWDAVRFCAFDKINK